MPAKALLLSSDADMQRVLRRVLDAIAVPLQISTLSEECRQLLNREKFDAIFIDFDEADTSDILDSLRRGKSNKSAIVFAALGASMPAKTAFEKGANFALEKPVSLERATRSIRAAYGLILSERSRYYRFALQTVASIHSGNSGELEATVEDVSRGGMRLRLSRPVSVGGAIRARFDLPTMDSRVLEVHGEIVWTTPDGALGVKFTTIAPKFKHELDDWLAKQGLEDQAAQAWRPPRDLPS